MDGLGCKLIVIASPTEDVQRPTLSEKRASHWLSEKCQDYFNGLPASARIHDRRSTIPKLHDYAIAQLSGIVGGQFRTADGTDKNGIGPFHMRLSLLVACASQDTRSGSLGPVDYFDTFQQEFSGNPCQA